MQVSVSNSRFEAKALVLCVLMVAFSGTLLARPTSAGDTPTASVSDPSVVETGSLVEFEPLAREYIQQFEELHRLKVENQFLELETARYEATTRFRTEKTLPESLTDLTAESQRQVVSLVDQNYAPFLKALNSTGRSVHEEVDRTRRNWLAVRTQIYSGQHQVFEAEAQNRFAAQFAQLLNVGNLWLWACAVPAGACLAGAYWFHHRQYYRRLFWVRKSSLGRRVLLLALLVLVPAAPLAMILTLGNQGYDSLLSLSTGKGASPRRAIDDAINELKASIKKDDLVKQNQEIWTRHDAAQAQWRKAIDSQLPKQGSELPNAWINSRSQVRDAVVGATLQSKFLVELQKDLGSLVALGKDLQEHRSSIAVSESRKRLVSGGLGAMLLSLYGGLSFVFVRGDRHRQRQMQRTCPRCLAVGKLERVVKDDGSGGRMGMDELRCSNIIRNDPYEECEFCFNAAYSDRIKLGFPTLGVASSGKTHWLAMVYRELNKGRYPEKVHFEKVKGEAAKEFDRTVDLILNSRIKTSATRADRLPHPLIFNFQDNDRVGKADLMLSIFDYAGQVTIDEFNFHRSRALDANGYFFFLDPTKPDETQVQALLSFREDLRLMKNLKTGCQIHIPVALCITKLDLMVNQPYAEGSDVIEQFYSDLRDIDQSSGVMTLDVIQKRSAAFSRLRETIWPGWHIERQIHDLFGDRFMFFPLTPIGLNNPGGDDLSGIIEPYAILEPLLWLLHMNGYPVLDRDQTPSKK